VRQVLRRPALAALLLLVIVFASGSAAFFVQKRSLEEGVSERLTDVQYAKRSLAYRISLIKKATEAATKYPAGTSYYGWFERANETHWPHNDFFLTLGAYGFPGAILFLLFVLLMLSTIKCTPLGVEKLFGRAILTFLLVMGLSMAQLYQKHFWIFLAFVMASERIAKFYMPTSGLETTVHYDEDSLMQDKLVLY
jgi:O-antigen ligase